MKAGTLKYDITIPLIRPKIQQMAIQIKRIIELGEILGKFETSAVICFLKQCTCKAGCKTYDTSCGKVGTFCNQTAGYADCDNETAGYVNGNVAEVTAGKEIFFGYANENNHQKN